MHVISATVIRTSERPGPYYIGFALLDAGASRNPVVSIHYAPFSPTFHSPGIIRIIPGMKFLITGVAGFIGFHVARCLLERGDAVVGLDNLNDYYAVALKQDRLRRLKSREGFIFQRQDIADKDNIARLCRVERPDIIIHLAAQAGVRYSLENPAAYIHSNISGFLTLLEACRHSPVRHLVYASSSSVYGLNKKIPFATDDAISAPASLYGATKAADELLAHAYHHLFEIPMTGLRFFTVYGPWGRPDMAYFKFTKSILSDTTIEVFNHGRHARDFTYIDDIVSGVIGALERDLSGSGQFKVYNLGNNRPVALMDFIAALERVIGVRARLNHLPMQPGDMAETYADIDSARAELGFDPRTGIEQGLAQFVKWYRAYFRV